MSAIPCFPDFVSLDIAQKEILHPRLSLTADGVSEFTFCGLYLFRYKYNYRISHYTSPYNAQNAHNVREEGFIISGEQYGKTFFMTPCIAPDWDTLETLFKTHDYWKNVPPSVLEPVRENLEKRGIVFTEDRDNFDYLYYRRELAELSGKKFHKKKNHANNFRNTYPDYEIKPMSAGTIPAAIEVLDQWRQNTVLLEDGDYRAAKEAVDLFDSLPLRGTVFFAGGKPVGYCLGESIARGRMFVLHFEKGIDEYRGVYQFVNQSFAASLPNFFTLINREQDLGNEGLRQAKMTYRPCDFVRKYKAVKS